MDTDSTMSLVFIQGITTLVATEARIMTRNMVNLPSARLFLLEMLATFQLCTCFMVLHPMADIDPKPQLYLAHIYSFMAVHFYLTLNESTSNPASTLVCIIRKGDSMRIGLLKIAAQFLGAFLARIYQNFLWSMRISSLFTDPVVCGNPLQTGLLKAFFTELISSITFQLSLLESQMQELRIRANMLSFATTSLIYAGGHLTGAIFNPALAFSMHLSCFSEKFWNYILVYWIAPCIGSVLVVIAWDEVLPLLRREM
uniref:Aquaporin-11 isoform X2 n=1 Tax=Pogona vitticeps TaxID=103695 RepID=A0A6J0V7Q9_9SAUR